MITAILTSNILFAESLYPPKKINTFQVGLRISKKIRKNLHYKVIGACLFTKWSLPPKAYTTLEVEAFLPDLIVSVYNKPDGNPWREAKAIYENKTALRGYRSLFKRLAHQEEGEGDTSSVAVPMHGRNERTRIVDVIGTPYNLIRFPFVGHFPEPRPFLAYYLSQADGFLERTELGEVEMLKHPDLLLHSPIGTAARLWGHELPRLMRVNNPYRYRASVVAAMHAADIATNSNNFHTPMPRLSNSCGQNCVISNVVFDASQKNIIWQEIYPNNRNIVPGNANDFGEADDRAGNGNYMFVVWRKYRGCTQAPGKLRYTTKKVGSPQKR